MSIRLIRFMISYKRKEVITMQFHERLKALREDTDYTQAYVAKILGTTQQQIYKYESGKQEPTLSRLKKLCLIYGVSADYLLDLPKNMKWPR